MAAKKEVEIMVFFHLLCRRFLGALLIGTLLCVQAQSLAENTNGYKAFTAARKALKNGDAELALKHLRKSLKTLSHWGLVHLEIAVAFRQLGEFGKEAGEAIKQATRLLPQNPRAHLFAGFFWEGAGKPKKAHYHFLRAVQLGHPSPEGCLHAARLALTYGQQKEVLACLQTLRRTVKYERPAHLLLAQSFEAAGKIDDSAYHWRWLTARSLSVFELQRCLAFFLRHIDKQPKKTQRTWKTEIKYIERKLEKLAPKRPDRRLRPLLPSRR
ncbi:MAG: hypothetical protein H6727_03580 [Myxococcales bacterium]|nr:hypothetical protein [Myxococcales bacterium]